VREYGKAKYEGAKNVVLAWANWGHTTWTSQLACKESTYRTVKIANKIRELKGVMWSGSKFVKCKLFSVTKIKNLCILGPAHIM